MLISKFREWKKRRAVKRFRKEIAFWGFNLDHLTDEEILIKLGGFGRRIAHAGVTAEQATRNVAQALGVCHD